LSKGNFEISVGRLVEETISITGSFSFDWTDPFLTWNPSLYGNVHWTIIDSSDMWLPFIVLINNVHKMEPIGSETVVCQKEISKYLLGIWLRKYPLDYI
jgi:hypothetical protein